MQTTQQHVSGKTIHFLKADIIQIPKQQLSSGSDQNSLNNQQKMTKTMLYFWKNSSMNSLTSAVLPRKLYVYFSPCNVWLVGLMVMLPWTYWLKWLKRGVSHVNPPHEAKVTAPQNLKTRRPFCCANYIHTRPIIRVWVGDSSKKKFQNQAF